MPPTVFPTGVTIYEPERAFNCYVLFDGRDDRAHLIDMNGNEVKVWGYTGFPAEMIDPQLVGGEKGHMFLQEEGPQLAARCLAEFDWEGRVVWRWGDKAPGGSANANHDQCRLANGNTLLLSKLKHVVAGMSDDAVVDEVIYEVTPEGDIVWEWKSLEHLDEFGFTPEGREIIKSGFTSSFPADLSGVLHLNDLEALGSNKWYDSGDERFHPDNLIIDSREGNFTAIIEKRTGKVIWRIGPQYPGMTESPYLRAFNREIPRPVDVISGQHDAHMIAKDLPGAGNILIFDNQGPAGYPPAILYMWLGSRVIEIDPVRKEIVWQYTAEDSGAPLWAFFSSFISSARRLPNGNTLICEGMNGRIFQVTAEGDIVWEYVSPHVGTMPRGKDVVTALTGGAVAEDAESVKTNWVFRAQAVPYEWVPDGTPYSEKALLP